MSYSFTITDNSKSAALDGVWERLNDIATTQPVHRLDLTALQTASRAVVMALADDPTQDVQVVMSGWVNARGHLSEEKAFGISVNIAANLVPRKS